MAFAFGSNAFHVRVSAGGHGCHGDGNPTPTAAHAASVAPAAQVSAAGAGHVFTFWRQYVYR